MLYNRVGYSCISCCKSYSSLADRREKQTESKKCLCLSSIHDKAFDIGMITITKEMTVKVSKCYMGSKDSFYEMALMAYDGKPIAVPEKFQPSDEFLSYHRENIYLDRG